MILVPNLPLKCGKCNKRTIYQATLILSKSYKKSGKKDASLKGYCPQCKQWKYWFNPDRHKLPGGYTSAACFNGILKKKLKILDRFDCISNYLENQFKKKGIELARCPSKLSRINHLILILKTSDQRLSIRGDLVEKFDIQRGRKHTLYFRFYYRNSKYNRWKTYSAVLEDDGTDQFPNL
jgi:hypothetical protein